MLGNSETQRALAGPWGGWPNRYERQFCFPVAAAGPPHLPGHVAEFALVGSDLHFAAGTDVTILFRMSEETRFRTAADLAIDGVRSHHALAESHEEYRGARVEHYTTANRAISLHRAFADGVAIYSNSATALRRVLDARAGGVQSLADVLDFRLFRTALPFNTHEHACIS